MWSGRRGASRVSARSRNTPPLPLKEQIQGEGERTSVLGGLVERDDKVTKCRSEEHEGENEEEEESAPLVDSVGRNGVALQSDGLSEIKRKWGIDVQREQDFVRVLEEMQTYVVHAEVDDDCHQSVPRNLDDDVGDHEDDPRVSPRGPLADLVGVALLDEVRHDLLNAVERREPRVSKSKAT